MALGGFILDSHESIGVKKKNWPLMIDEFMV